jgi:transposase
MAGLTPRVHESGTSVRPKPRISRQGNASLRKSLFMPALVVIQKTKNPLGQFYRRLVASGKAKKVAICAVTRKLLVLMRALVVHETRYFQNFKTEGKPVQKSHDYHPRLRLIPKF